MFSYRLSQHAYMHSLDAFLGNLPQEKIKEIFDNMKSEGSVEVNISLNGVSLNQQEVTSCLEKMFTELTKRYRERLNRIIAQERKVLKKRYSNVEKSM